MNAENAGRAAEIVIEFVLPGFGATIIVTLQLLRDMIAQLKGEKDKFNGVVEHIGFLEEELKNITDSNRLEQSKVLPKLARTISEFAKLIEKHMKKRWLSRFLSHHQVNAEIQEFHTKVDQYFQLLGLEDAREAYDWRRRFEANARRGEERMMERMDNMQHTLLAEYRGRDLKEAVMVIQFAITSNENSNAYLFSLEDVVWMRQTLTVLFAHAPTLQAEAVPSWFLPFDDVTCPDTHFDMGTFGSVHRGTWKGTEVVIKRLLVVSDQVEATFLNEATIWNGLNHPHVLKMLGACHVSTPLFFVCEDASNGNFVEFFKNKENKQHLWHHFHQAALGLLYLHSQKVVHGDLKCNNLLVGADNKTKICDFGFSFIRSESKALSEKAQADAVRWKALECLEGANPSFASDVYSLGMCIIEAVSGEEPWTGMTDEQILDKFDALEGHHRPEGFTDKQWDLVQQMTEIDAVNRIPLGDIVQLLAELAREENVRNEEMERRRLAEQQCPRCLAVSNEGARFCSECGYGFTISLDSHP